MMLEDKLTTEQRIRLEALNQAVMSSMHGMGIAQPSTIITRAKKFEQWIKTGSVPADEDKH